MRKDEYIPFICLLLYNSKNKKSYAIFSFKKNWWGFGSNYPTNPYSKIETKIIPKHDMARTWGIPWALQTSYDTLNSVNPFGGLYSLCFNNFNVFNMSPTKPYCFFFTPLDKLSSDADKIIFEPTLRMHFMYLWTIQDRKVSHRYKYPVF